MMLLALLCHGDPSQQPPFLKVSPKVLEACRCHQPCSQVLISCVNSCLNLTLPLEQLRKAASGSHASYTLPPTLLSPTSPPAPSSAVIAHVLSFTLGSIIGLYMNELLRGEFGQTHQSFSSIPGSMAFLEMHICRLSFCCHKSLISWICPSLSPHPLIL